MSALHPQSQAVIDAAINSGRPPLNALDPVAARVLFRETRKALLPPAPDVALTRDQRIPGPLGDIPVRLYRPLGSTAAQPLPGLIYFHGGGWVVGDLETHDVLCRQLSNAARGAVIAVDYRMGPEHRFPAAVDEAVAVTRYVAANAAQFGIDATRLAVGGDSAGGNLATVAAIVARDHGAPALRFQLLIYPATDMSMSGPSHTTFGQGYLLTHELMIYFRDHYLRSSADVDDWRASPMKTVDLARLPPALIATASHDPLVDEGERYAQRLRQAGVPVTYRCYPGMLHGFFIMGAVVDMAHQAVVESAEALAQALR